VHWVMGERLYKPKLNAGDTRERMKGKGGSKKGKK
jgi:hypothetical protein